MSFVTCGLNYKTAPVALRENFVFPREKLANSLVSLTAQTGIAEAAILSTCNRTEVYCYTQQDPAAVKQWLADFHHLPAANLTPYLYLYKDQHTVQHVFRVASGLDSMMLGEPQIFGQLKEAVKIAEASGTLGQHLRRLFQHAFLVGKKVRTHTAISANPITLGYAVVHLAQRIFADLANSRVLLIGAGEITQLIAKHLRSFGIKHLCIANRTLATAQAIAESVQAQLIPLQEIAAQLMQADIVVTAVQSDLPIIGKGIVESAVKLRKRRPMLIVDLGMPRNVESEIQQLEDVYLYALNDLQHILEENRHKRQDAVQDAEQIIDEQANHFVLSLQSLQATQMIRQYRNTFNQLRDSLLIEAFQEINMGDDPKEVLEKFSYRLTNKFLHQPSVALRQAAYRGDWKFIDAVEKLFVPEK